MAKMHILAGDFLQGEGEYNCGAIIVETALFPWPGARINADEIRSVTPVPEIATHQLDTLRPLGLTDSLLLGLNANATGPDGTPTTFWITLKDGRKLLTQADEPTYRQLQQQVAIPDFFTHHE
ncbi:hypothetical protein M2401_003732 [Pseudomonas sp. JUb42]|uniref:hypothetical protein n=1 Tax=Pseudomonas sp. JUb42 TaxID=2940611 RepID=UPI0021690E6B|nr:hypothetical protein [Pseudomonas sp. JUb42]MCS3469982.1 hypothetical protein [Pseudomonas sp. JUb42]